MRAPASSASHGPTPSQLMKAQGTSRLAFGATTAALIALASGGTAVLVAHATRGVGSPTSLPQGALPPDLGRSPGDSVVVGGTSPVAPVARRPLDPTEQAFVDALSRRTVPGRRVVTVPLVNLPGPVPSVSVGRPSPVTLPVGRPVPSTRPSVPSVPLPVVTPPTTGGVGPVVGTGGKGPDGTGSGEGPQPTPTPTQAPSPPPTGDHDGDGGDGGGGGGGGGDAEAEHRDGPAHSASQDTGDDHGHGNGDGNGNGKGHQGDASTHRLVLRIVEYTGGH